MAVPNLLAQTSYLIVPGLRVGPITKKVSEAELKKIYGRKNVQSTVVGLGEGETLPGTVMFPNDPKRKIEIVWKDKKKKRYPEFIQIYGKKSFWKTKEGISLGTSLKELEKINGKSFILMGFEWDYSGTVSSWNGGKLAKIFGKEGQVVNLRLDPEDYRKASRKDLDAVVGDGDFSSKNKAMQRINPKVYFMIVNFP